mmetsp:Transcript_9131/g.30437  ORF Transcript_9131/g.30437 Transcript_9131/m.30437 type:complete len:102 (-) Transcript_9131:45-350(-)
MIKFGISSITDEQLDSVMFEADLDGNGEIDEEEFATLFRKFRSRGNLNFSSVVKNVIMRDFNHLRRNWYDEAKQYFTLVMIFVVLMVVLYHVGNIAMKVEQ